jgi:hypothetical protein
LYGKIAAGEAPPRQTAEQLSILIEADLPFKITSRSAGGWLPLLMAVDALIDGANVDDAATLIRSGDNDQVRTEMSAWDQTTLSRIRRRIRRLGTDQVADVINACVAVDRPRGS